MITETAYAAAPAVPVNKAVVFAGDYLNKLAGERIERECRSELEKGAREIVVDFSQTEVINSIGISILLDVIDSASRSGASVTFADLKDESIELLDMLGLTRHVTIA